MSNKDSEDYLSDGETTARGADDDSSSSSSDDSDGEEGEDSGYDNGGGQPTLSLMDGASILIQQGPEDEEDEGEADIDTGISTQADTETEVDKKLEEEKKELDKKVKKKKKRKKIYYICLTNCKYDVVRKNSKRFGFKEVSDDDEWTLYWTDYSVALERVMEMKKYQKINHFPGMSEICRKDMLARNLNRMLKMYPKEYNIFPKTWCLPADYGDFQAYTRQKKNKTYILKPETGCQGKGIWVTKNPKEIKPHEHMICQQYMPKPFLIDNFKFDFRLYVLVTSCDPFRIFLFNDGLARFATNKYVEPSHNNIDNVFMHLTNYAINKHSEDFVRDDEAGSKRRISTINRFLKDKGYDIDKMWTEIDDVVIKTLISAHSILKHNYRTCFPNHVKGSACFEILGFDILLDRKLRPQVLEVNHSPSFNTDSELDREIKGALVMDSLNLVNFGACDRRKCIEEEKKRIKDRLMGRGTKKESKEELEMAQTQYQEYLERYENNHMGNFRRIFPNSGSEKYEKFFHSSGTLFQETAAFKARSEMARQQRDEIARKKEKLESMLKGKKSQSSIRPESPNSRRRRSLKRTTMPSRRLSGSRNSCSETIGSESDRRFNDEPLDTSKPMDILEEEELERISGLLQRDNLVRGLGIVEHVYRLLHCTPGTMGVMKTDSRPLPPPLDNHRWLCANRQNESCLAGQRAPIRIKDRQYYKKLLDRYFGHNHALANENITKTEKNASRSGHNRYGTNYDSSVFFHAREDPNRQFPQVRLSYSTNDRKVVLTHQPFTQDDIENEELFDLESGREADLTRRQHNHHHHDHSLSSALTNSMHTLTNNDNNSISSINQPNYNSGRVSTWQGKAGSLSNLNEKTVPSYQRNKFVKKPLGGNPRSNSGALVIQESEFRSNLSHLLDTEAERNRILARNGYASDWRSDVATPNSKRTLSAQGQRKDGGFFVVAENPVRSAICRSSYVPHLPRVAPNNGPPGLSVVSAPAPVVQRPDLGHPGSATPGSNISRIGSQQSISEGQNSASLRSTKSQRIRGASNNLRIRQIELRENHATVLS
ncbi:tubulin polyglutamylase ttll6-like isoform X3 [Mytilus californianus]|uniref:tubulin polyglutamylase ttll6-like isoform X3 n=1 Tax=Mytilus californianus TaxID=6549 RepID=UPI002247B6D3|nr:tubulin polyglutamylase ttll6-like isoform X3 [Mytilus californianus]